MLDPLLSLLAERGGRDTHRALELTVLRALALQAAGRDGEALTAIERALSVAEPSGYGRSFVDDGPPMARLLYQAAAAESGRPVLAGYWRPLKWGRPACLHGSLTWTKGHCLSR